MTGVLEQMKTDRVQGARVAGAARARLRPIDGGTVPALLVEHVTKRFMVGRKRRPVVAINDVTLRI
ncbi:MAG: hypothetical protein M3O93_07945, partial [Chloroflexota bacterium]|nr:hypothetical protein [Chloroflexota bacterium]